MQKIPSPSNVFPNSEWPTTLSIHTSKLDRHFLYSKKRTPGLTLNAPRNYALYTRDNDEKDGQPLNHAHSIIKHGLHKTYGN
jgi:hypothetical protein